MKPSHDFSMARSSSPEGAQEFSRRRQPPDSLTTNHSPEPPKGAIDTRRASQGARLAPRGLNRRDFLSRTAAGLTGAAYAARSARADARVLGANERIRLAFVGTRGQGQYNLKIFLRQPNVEVPVVCDVDQLQTAAARKLTDGRAEMVQDYRTLLDRKDLDALVVCTPDHWHAIITIHGCQAGKDVYVEKPLSLCIAEGRRMVEVARKHGRIVQTGTQQRSAEHYAEARDLIRGGTLGKVFHVYAWQAESRWPGPKPPPKMDPPPTLDWDMWLGPRPFIPYNRLRCSGSHRFFWDYAGGQMTDMGTHHMETIHWFMGVQAPAAVTAAGGKLAMNDAFETPDTLNAVWEYPGFTLEFAIREGNAYTKEGSPYGLLFFGTHATLYIDRSGYEIIPEKDRAAAKVVGRPRKLDYQPEPMSERHIANFLDCMSTRKLPNTDVEIGQRATTVTHLGNIAYRTGRKIRWDAEKEQIIDDPGAGELLTRTYRAPYLLPEV